MRQGLFEVYGDGLIGLKAEDLNRNVDLIDGIGLTVPEGMVIASGVFDQLQETLDIRHFVSPKMIVNMSCPDFLTAFNREILGKMDKDRPYAVRSSALAERGGIGIYVSAFFWPTGDETEDLQKLWQAECVVYASELSEDADLWRTRNNAPAGMAILIQPVVGSSLGGHFLPALSGSAYTTYCGQPAVRAVIGLGTKAADGEGIVFGEPPENALELAHALWEQKKATSLTETGPDEIFTDTRGMHSMIADANAAFTELFEKLAALKKHGDFYLEWAIQDGKTFVVQIAPYEDKPAGDIVFDSRDHITLLQSTDVLHSGRVTCRRIVCVNSWSRDIAILVEALNREIKGHLLIVPQLALSTMGDHPEIRRGGEIILNQRLGFRHFSNAAVVIEKQRRLSELDRTNMSFLGIPCVDHSHGRGATHFAQLCGRSDILFMGAEFDSSVLMAVPGMTEYRGCVNISIWDVVTEAVCDAERQRGSIFIPVNQSSDEKTILPSQIMDWSLELREAANRLSDAGEEERAAPLYDVHYALPNYHGDDPSAFNPFVLDKNAVEMCGGMDKVKASLGTVLDQGRNHVENRIWDNGLGAYLKELLAHLA